MSRSADSGQDTPAEHRVFEVDASFEAAGAWAGVDQLAETAYLSLAQMKQDAILEQHRLELHMVLLNYRDRIRPKYPCLTDTASPSEKTRYYAADRAYRLVHGLVGMVLQWKQALRDDRGWTVIVHNFGQAQHLSQRFFTELARRGSGNRRIEVITETQPGGFHSTPALCESEVSRLQTQVAGEVDAAQEPQYLRLLAHYRSTRQGPAAAQVAMRLLIIYNSYGYYYETRSLLNDILPYFDEIVGGDEDMRIFYVAKINIGLVMTGDPQGAISVLGAKASGHLTRPRDLAHMHYILAMHHLRYAEVRDIEQAEIHITKAVDIVNALQDQTNDAFLKVFIGNGLAFLRARQGRHREAVEICRSGYDFLTTELGEDKHRLHRSVLQYNIAQVFVMLGCLDEGLEHYHNALRMDPNYSEYYNEIGNILQRQDRYQEAVQYYQRAIECSAPYPEVFFNRAICHFRLQELDDALAYFDTTLELDPAQPEAHALRADVLRELERFDEALAGYDTAIASGCDSTVVRVNRAVLHYNNGAFERALADMDHVIAADPQDPEHYANRAAIHQAMQQDDLYRHDIRMAAQYREAA